MALDNEEKKLRIERLTCNNLSEEEAARFIELSEKEGVFTKDELENFLTLSSTIGLCRMKKAGLQPNEEISIDWRGM
jgi:hypothetical protein